MQKEKLVVLFTVFVDVIGFGIVIPILPFYVGSFGASPFVITLLFASFAFFAFLSSPFLGALSDKIGRRPILIASITSTAIGWFVFAGATSIPLLFLGRIIDGSAAGNFTVAQGSVVFGNADLFPPQHTPKPSTAITWYRSMHVELAGQVSVFCSMRLGPQ